MRIDGVCGGDSIKGRVGSSGRKRRIGEEEEAIFVDEFREFCCGVSS